MENQVSTGLSQFTAGANGLVTSGNIIGAPATYATGASLYAAGCTLYQRDSSTGYRTVVWQNTGTAAVPVWTSLAIANILLASVLGATAALTQAQAGSTIVLDRAAGTVITLPAPVVGTTFAFEVLTSVTSNAYKIITSGASIFMLGSLMNIDTDTSNAVAAWTADGSTIVSASMNGTTTGGLKGTSIMLKCISSTIWMVTGIDQGSGTVATPFATS